MTAGPHISRSLTSPGRRTSRPLDVHNILNPTPQKATEGRRRSTAHFDSPRSSSMANLQNSARSLPPSPIESSDPSESSRTRGSRPHTHGVSRVNRPSSLGIVTPQQHPYGFASRRFSEYSAGESIGSGPPQSAPPPPQQGSSSTSSGYPFPSTPVSHSYPQHHQYQPQQPVSTSVSPTTSYSSYLPPGQATLSAVSGSNTFGSQYATSNQHPLHSPYHSGQHGAFPMMALATAHGSIPVSVDTTAASKSADEKRKRNAGASARFRQRRKEREREMNSRISDLEQRLKKAEDERDYYRDMYMRMPPQSGRAQPPPLTPGPPGPLQPPQGQPQHQHPQYQHQHPQQQQIAPRLPPPPQHSIESPQFGHHPQHPPPGPSPSFPRIGSDHGQGFGGAGGREGGAGMAPGFGPPPSQQGGQGDYSPHGQQTRDRRGASSRYEQEHGRHH